MEFKKADLNKDLEGIWKVAKLSFETPYSKDKIRERLKGRKYWIYVARDKDRIVGFKIWYEESPTRIYSWLGAVHPKYRRRGIARELLKIQFKIAKKQEYRVVGLKTHIGHPEMIAFVEKEGFDKIRVEKDHWSIGKDAIFYDKEL